jgi:hypothetical protein
MLDTGYSMLDAGCWMLDTGCLIKIRYKVEGIGWKVKKEDIRLTAHDARQNLRLTAKRNGCKVYGLRWKV